MPTATVNEGIPTPNKGEEKTFPYGDPICIPYGYCVHAFVSDVPNKIENKNENNVMIQSNHESIIKNIREELRKKHGDKYCEKVSLFLIKIKGHLCYDLLKEIEDVVDNIISQSSNNKKSVFKFCEKSDDPMFEDIKLRVPTIILW